MKSDLEQHLLFQIKVLELPEPEREYVFAKPRKFRFDFAWVDKKLAVECEGGVYSGGRHVTGKGFEKDCEKYNLAILNGWRVLRFTSGMIESGDAVALIEKMLDEYTCPEILTLLHPDRNEK